MKYYIVLLEIQPQFFRLAHARNFTSLLAVAMWESL